MDLTTKPRTTGPRIRAVKTSLFRSALCGTLALAFAAGVAQPARADEQTVRLIQLLIKKGILTPGQATDLLQETGGGGTPRARKHAAPAAPAAPIEAEEAPPGGQIRVTYVPQFIRKQIADEVRAQVMDQAQTEGWAQPNALPEWTKRFRLYGDFRLRYDMDTFDNNNYNQFVNFNSINNGSAFDANSYGTPGSSQTNPPFLNTTEDRERIRLRARLGVDADIDDWITGELRLATGSDNSPVSFNQTLGSDFEKYAIWLDRAYLKMNPYPGLTILAGRFYNPFLPSDLMYYPDLDFDGIAVNYRRQVFDKLSLFGTIGGFPVFNSAFDFSTNSDEKYGSSNAYMVGAQLGADYYIRHDIKAQLGVGIFDFLGVQGAVSSPCYVQPGNAYYCDTDDTRPAFVQFGNTLYPIRNIVPEATTNGALPPDPQYYGLASRFNVLDIHPRVDITTYDPIDIEVEGQYIKNLAYDYEAIVHHIPPGYGGSIGPVNNLGSNGYYQGGDTGWMLKTTVGNFELHKLWDWNASLSYRYLETDATLDAIDDSEFHLGGTNAKGYILAGNLGIARNTWLGLKWLSSEAVSGPHYGTDSLYLELNSRF
jgi:hypothetical protein